MIKGIGIDIIEIERIAAAIKRRKEAFIERLFTENERLDTRSGTDEYLATHYAGRFAAKEAVTKALGTGFRGIDWKDIEIVNDELGKPSVILSFKIAERFSNPQLLISISHSKVHACAFCLWQG
jgi:holo-[acyl-carrier protein] synthase